MRRLAAFAAIALIIVAPAPAAQAAGSAIQVITCAKLGYQIIVPSDWTVNERCTRMMGAVSANILLTVFVEKHGWWSDARSRSSLLTDMHNAGPNLITPRLRATTVTSLDGQRPYRGMIGVTEVRLATVPILFTQVETFAHGEMYKFRFVSALANLSQDEPWINAVAGTIGIGVNPYAG